MPLISFAREELTPKRTLQAFLTQQCVLLRGRIDVTVARNAHQALTKLMRDHQFLGCNPYDPKTRTGYTPPGIEHLQRSPGEPTWTRDLFDVGSALMPQESPDIELLFIQAARTCRTVLDALNNAVGPQISPLPQGRHSLRTAQYLQKGTTCNDVLFPAHRDFSMLTAFIGAGQVGLEVRVADTWHPVDLHYGDVLIGAGTPLPLFVYELKPLLHRVVGGDDERVSSFLFYELADHVMLPKSRERYGAMLRRVLADIN